MDSSSKILLTLQSNCFLSPTELLGAAAGLLAHFFFFCKFVTVSCSRSENGTFQRPQAMIGDNGAGYLKTKLSRLKQDVWPLSKYPPKVRKHPVVFNNE